MNAKEARIIAKQAAPKIKAAQTKFQRIEAQKAKEKEKSKHNAWRNDFEKILTKVIGSASKNGKLCASYTLEDNGKNVDTFMANFEFAKDLKQVIAKFEREDYRIELTTKSTEHDERAAYMNSGGECGSETTWWTTDVVLIISW